MNTENTKLEGETEIKNIVSVGDVVVGSTGETIETCSNLVIKLIENKNVKNYLGDSFIKKKLRTFSGIG